MNNGTAFPNLAHETIPCDPRLARLVCGSYYGELSAISGYIYRAIMTEESCKSLSELFEQIAIDEMHHFRILGRLIRLLGGNPTICTNVSVSSVHRGELCSPCCGESRSILLTESIREEETALAEYKKLAKAAGSGTVATLFLRIAADEERHIRLLKEFRMK